MATSKFICGDEVLAGPGRDLANLPTFRVDDKPVCITAFKTPPGVTVCIHRYWSGCGGMTMTADLDCCVAQSEQTDALNLAGCNEVEISKSGVYKPMVCWNDVDPDGHSAADFLVTQHENCVCCGTNSKGCC